MSEFEYCQETIIHQDVVDEVAKAMLKEDEILDLSLMFKMLADETRLKILRALSVSEMCVCDLSSLLKMSHSAVSHQLSNLKKSRLVRPRKQGKVVYYSLMDDHVLKVIEIAYEHVQE